MRGALLKNKIAGLFVTVSYDFLWPEVQGQHHLRVLVLGEKTKGMDAEKKQEEVITGEQR